MKKYRVQCGAFISVLRHRTFTVYADSEVEAAEKAEDNFRNVGLAAGWDVDSVEIDSIEEVQNEKVF